MAKATTQIPVAAMARAHVETVFPALTAAQCHALRHNLPVPPSPDWFETPQENAASRQSVLCVMVCGLAARLRLARQAVMQFLAQSHPRKTLLIFNGTTTPVLTDPVDGVVEMTNLEWGDDVAVLRTLALNAAAMHMPSDLVYPHWDDDDLYHPHMLSSMASCCVEPRYAVALSHQVRVNIRSSTAFVHESLDGIPSTIMVPATMAYELPYAPESGGACAREWYKASLADRTTVVLNSDLPELFLRVGVYHGANLTSPDLFMRQHQTPGRWDVPPAAAVGLLAILGRFGLTTEIKAAMPAPAPEEVHVR
jgi:hypothetical protein